MRFPIPQFIEHSPKIVGPLTFKQFSFVGGAGGICFFLFYLLPQGYFVFFSLILIIGGISFAFLKINGKSLPLVLSDVFKFNLDSKIYIWKKKEQPMILYSEKESKPLIKKSLKEQKDKNALLDPLKIIRKSRLKAIQTNIETKTK